MFATSIRAILVAFAMPASAQMIEDFGSRAPERWVYVADGVMGGVSSGRALFEGGVVRLIGEVSTDNNGGFIQVRYRFGGGWPVDAEGLTLDLKGNGEDYYVFLRTAGLARPWFSYRSAFPTTADWTEVTLPFDHFRAARQEMPQGFSPDQVISIGLVAYGRDFDADLSVRKIALYR